jgi:hypothetical protein
MVAYRVPNDRRFEALTFRPVSDQTEPHLSALVQQMPDSRQQNVLPLRAYKTAHTNDFDWT